MPDGHHRSPWGDLAAGLCVAGLLIPEAVAYAGLAQLPVAHALIASMIGLGLYAVFGGSRFAIVSPTSSTATLAAAAVLSVPAATGTSQASTYVPSLMALVLMTGLILMALAWARQGMLSAFVSRPVLRGFAFALGITIVIKQLPDALGLALPGAMVKDALHVLAHVLTHLSSAHWASALVAAAAASVIWLLRRWPKVPASMAVIVLAIVAAQWLDLTALGVAEVGAIERPTLMLAIPDLPSAQWMRLSELAFGLVVLVFAESWGSMRTMALNHGDTLNADRELLVLGACNVASGLMQGMVVGAGFSASSANAAAGAHSRRSGAIALVVIVLTLLLALPAMHLLPRPVLAVAVISALWHALSPGPLLAVWRMNRDRWLIIGAVAGVLMLGVLHGMLAAIGLSLLGALKRFSQPVMHELGALGQSRNYVTLDVHPEASSPQDLLILRPEEPLFFASAERVVADVMARVALRPAVKSIVLSLEESSDLDSTAAECLLELDRRLSAMGRLLSLARVKEPVRALLHQLDPTGVGHHDRLFWSVDDAVQAQITPRSAL
jgi:SulP family sulfate permease